MKHLSLTFFVFILLLACNSPSNNSEQSDVVNEATLGDLQHQFTIYGPARDAFDRGLLLLHSFEYEDSREAFQEAIEASPNELMAYWGEAMTYYSALWGLQDLEAGRAVLARVGDSEEDRLAMAGDDLERGFWKGVEILYGEGELMERNMAYADHMSIMYENFDGNQEVAAFYALGLMWAIDPSGKDNSIASAEIAEGILAENPNHPGALHYVIHAYDDPALADKAEEAANNYSKVAPDATHALHMPSHIYLAMGMWNNVVASNETSYAASVKRMERKGLGDEARGFHSYAWLHYGYLQQKRYDDAARLLEDMYPYAESAGTPSARFYLILMQNFQRIETGEIPGEKWKKNVPYNDLGLSSKAGVHFLNAMMAMDAGDALAIDHETDTLEMYIAAAELIVTDEGIALCSAGPTRYAPNKKEILRTRVMAEEMKAMKAQVENDKAAIEKHLKSAVALENELGSPVGPPVISYPSYDMYGHWLIEQERWDEALEVFNAGLTKTPNRRMTLEGKEVALRALGKKSEADEVAEILTGFVREESRS